MPAGALFGVSGFFLCFLGGVFLKLALNTDVVIALTPRARLHAVARLLPPARSHSFVRLLLWLAAASCCRPQLVSFNTRRSTSHTACTASRLHVLSRPTPSLSVSFLLRFGPRGGGLQGTRQLAVIICGLFLVTTTRHG